MMMTMIMIIIIITNFFQNDEIRATMAVGEIYSR